LTRWGRPLAIAAAIVFLISSAFPVVAGLAKNSEAFPSWWGPLDVGVAFFLAVLAFAVMGLAQGHVDRLTEQAAYRAYRVLTHGILAMCVVFLLFSNQITWLNCLPGFAWRAWLLLYGLPAWLAAFAAAPAPGAMART
jgi:hypothetical protein